MTTLQSVASSAERNRRRIEFTDPPPPEGATHRECEEVAIKVDKTEAGNGIKFNCWWESQWWQHCWGKRP